MFGLVMSAAGAVSLLAVAFTVLPVSGTGDHGLRMQYDVLHNCSRAEQLNVTACRFYDLPFRPKSCIKSILLSIFIILLNLFYSGVRDKLPSRNFRYDDIY
jgi:hypothetical protein